MRTEFPMELITGVESIDLQHMELVARIQVLHESYLNGTNAEKLAETMEYLKCYVVEHFATEEKYMKELNYPGYKKHAKIHQEFVEDFSKLTAEFKQKGLSSDFNLDFNVKLIDWMKNHVLGEDKVLADFIRCTQTSDINNKNSNE